MCISQKEQYQIKISNKFEFFRTYIIVRSYIGPGEILKRISKYK
jgi:hypothetical protein